MNSRRFRPGMAVSVIVLTILCTLMMLPLLFTFLYSFFPKSEIASWLARRGSYDSAQWMPFIWSPQVVSFRQYYTILIENPTYLKYFCNSAFYTGATLLGQALIVPLTAYALSRFRFFGRDALFFMILVLMILPFQVTMAPSVIVLRRLGLLGTVWSVILPMIFSPFYIFLMRQFMVSIPGEILEAGMVDGAGPIRCYVHVILPVCRPILGAAAALSFADLWNMVEQPMIYLSGKSSLQPLSTMFNQISTEGSDVAFAGAALYILPALLIYLYFQEDIVTGIQLSELK